MHRTPGSLRTIDVATEPNEPPHCRQWLATGHGDKCPAGSTYIDQSLSLQRVPVIASLDGRVALLSGLRAHVRGESSPLVRVSLEVFIKRLVARQAEAADRLLLVSRVLGANVSQLERGAGQMVKHDFHSVGHERVELPNDRVVAVLDFARLRLGKVVGAHRGNADQMLESVDGDANLGRKICVRDGPFQRNMSWNLEAAQSLHHSCFRALSSHLVA